MKKKLSIKEMFTSKNVKIGAYSVVISLIVIALAVAVNIIVGLIPSTSTSFDITANGKYTLSEQSEKIVKANEKDVTFYWLVETGKENTDVSILLDRYSALSDKIKIVKKDPDIYPTFAASYGVDEAVGNSVIVECGDKYKYISYSDMLEYNYTSYYSYDTSFCGENLITGAFNYVTSDTLPKIYTLTGHGEEELSDTFKETLTNENYETDSLSLISLEAVPEDADAVMIYSPSSDISEEEKDKLNAYLSIGGNLIFIASPAESGHLTNLEAVMAEMGVTEEDGIVVEGSSSNYAWGTPYYLIPEYTSHEITDPLIDGGYYVLMPVSGGLTVSDTLPENITVSTLLSTSTSAYSKVAGYAITTYDKEDGDTDGPFSLAVAVTNKIDDSTEGKIIWISSAAIMDETVNERVSGGNQNFVLNAIAWMCSKEESISIRSISLAYEYLTVPDGTSSLIAVVLIGIIPLIYLGIGIYITVKRKRK